MSQRIEHGHVCEEPGGSQFEKSPSRLGERGRTEFVVLLWREGRGAQLCEHSRRCLESVHNLVRVLSPPCTSSRDDCEGHRWELTRHRRSWAVWTETFPRASCKCRSSDPIEWMEAGAITIRRRHLAESESSRSVGGGESKAGSIAQSSGETRFRRVPESVSRSERYATGSERRRLRGGLTLYFPITDFALFNLLSSVRYLAFRNHPLRHSIYLASGEADLREQEHRRQDTVSGDMSRAYARAPIAFSRRQNNQVVSHFFGALSDQDIVQLRSAL